MFLLLTLRMYLFGLEQRQLTLFKYYLVNIGPSQPGGVLIIDFQEVRLSFVLAPCRKFIVDSTSNRLL